MPIVGAARTALDFVLRLLFFALAPFVIVVTAALYPVTGALINIAVALVVVIASEAVRPYLASSPWLRAVLRRPLEIEEYYRTRTPRPFVYYVFYPLLFPYWLAQRDARREFLLFKGYTLWTFAVLLASSAHQYFVYWRPELGFERFLPTVAQTLVVESILVLAFLMPIATTVIEFHRKRRRIGLAVLLGVAVFSVGVAVWGITRRRDPIVSIATRTRVRLRSGAYPRRARDAQVAALRAAWVAADTLAAAVEGDGKVEGIPLQRAHELLEAFYKHDEAFCFDLWASPRRKPKIIVLYVEARRGKPAIWLALRRDGAIVREPKELPRGAFVAMKHAAGV